VPVRKRGGKGSFLAALCRQTRRRGGGDHAADAIAIGHIQGRRWDFLNVIKGQIHTDAAA